MALPDLQAELDVAIEAARCAGEAVMRHFQRGEPVHFKSPDQPVTEADLAANRILREMLMLGRPQHGWLSEESVDSADRLGRQRLWIVDPIDGTNSFIAGLPEFAISIGLVEADQPIVGVILNPATGECFHAARGMGSFLNGQRIHVAAPPAASPLMYASRAEMNAGELEGVPQMWDIRLIGSTAYRMCGVAAGTVHAAWSGRMKHDWDICAAALIVSEAGGIVTDASGGALVFNRPIPTHRGVIASSGASLPGFPRVRATAV